MTAYNETIIEIHTLSETDSTQGNLTYLTLENQTLSELITLARPLFFTDNINVTTSEIAQAIARIFEDIRVTDVLSNTGIFNYLQGDTFSLRDLTAISYTFLLEENITVDDPATTIVTKLQAILEYLNLLDTSTSQMVANTSLAVSLAILDLVGQRDIVLEGLTVSDTFLSNLKLSQSIVELVSSTLVDSNNISFFEVVTEDSQLNDTLTFQQNLKNLLTESIFFSTLSPNLGNIFSSWVVNPENYAVSNYSNYDFNNADLFDTKYLLSSSSGLYELGGTVDETSYIQSRIKTAVLDFGSSSLKQIPEILLGVNNSGKVILRTMVDDINEVYYELVSSTSGLATQQIKLGKGLYGRYWQFELITEENSTFDLDTFEFLPIKYGRKLR